jgi:glutathione S-transferase
VAYAPITANRNYSSWSLRPWLLMKAPGIPFIDRVEPFTAAVNTAFVRFSPTAKVPVLIEGDRMIHESLAITLYLADRHDGVWPTDAEARA